MVTHLRNFLEEHGLYVTVVKYLFTIFLSVMSYRNHSDWGYILVTAVEVISIAAITNIFAKEQKLIAYLVNSVLVLIINIQNITMIFGGSFVTLVMVTNLESLESLSGQFGPIAIGAAAVFFFSFLPAVYISIPKMTSPGLLSFALLIELIFTLVCGNIYSPLFSVYQLAEASIEYRKNLAEIASAPNTTSFFYKPAVLEARQKPEKLPENPNVVLIMVEGLSQNIIDDDRNIMLNLKQLQNESLSFENYYNHTFATYRGIIGQLYSGYQLDNYDENKLTSIQSVLKDRNYQTTFINTEPNNTQFNSYLESMGFDQLTTDLTQANGVNASLTDKTALELLYQTIEKQATNSNPYFTMVYTYGTHLTFDSPNEQYGNGENPLLNKFYNFDVYLKGFLDKFNSNPAFDNTILVLTSDHAIFADKEFIETFPSANRDNPDVDEVPLVMYYKGITPETIDVEGRNSLSLVPTILDYMDVSVPNYFLGDTLFYFKENNNSYDTVFFDNTYLLSTDYGNIQSLSDTNEETIRSLLQKYFAAKFQEPQIPE